MKNKTQFEKEWQNTFSESAESHNLDYQISIWSEAGLECYLAYFFEYLNPHLKRGRRGNFLLDIGCGPGTFARVMAQKGFNVYGVDYSAAMIRKAKEKSNGYSINYRVGEIYHLPYKNNSFDMVICLGVFQHLEKPAEALRELKRVMKDEGLLIIHTLNAFSLYRLFLWKDNTLKRYNPFQFKRLLQNEEFHKVSLKGIYLFPKPFYFITRIIKRLRLYEFFNIFFYPVFFPLSHSFYVEAREVKE